MEHPVRGPHGSQLWASRPLAPTEPQTQAQRLGLKERGGALHGEALRGPGREGPRPRGLRVQPQADLGSFQSFLNGVPLLGADRSRAGPRQWR